MGIFFRKSFRLGKGLGLNLGSKSMSVSTGIPGLRLSAGTRGVRLYGGKGIFRFQKSLSSSSVSHSNHEPASINSKHDVNRLFRLQDGETQVQFDLPVHKPTNPFGWILFIGLFLLMFSGIISVIIPLLLIIIGALGIYYGTPSMRGYRIYKKALKQDSEKTKARFYREALALYNDPGIKCLLASYYYNEKLFQDAKIYLTDIVSMYPQPETIAITAQCLMKTGDLEDSLYLIQLIDEEEEFDGFMTILVLKAECFSRMKQYDKALACIQTGLAKRKEEYTEMKRYLRLWKVRVLQVTGKKNDARAELDALLKEVPDFKPARNLMTNLTSDLHRLEF